MVVIIPKIFIVIPSSSDWLSLWLLPSDKKSAKNEEISFGQKKKDIYGKKKVGKTAQPLKQTMCRVM